MGFGLVCLYGTDAYGRYFLHTHDFEKSFIFQCSLLAQTTLTFNTQPATISKYQQQTDSMDLRLPLASSKDSSPDEKSIFLTQKAVKLCLEDQSRDGITSTKSKEPRTSRSSLEPLKDSTDTRTSALHQQGVQLDRPYSPISSFEHEASALDQDDDDDDDEDSSNLRSASLPAPQNLQYNHSRTIFRGRK